MIMGTVAVLALIAALTLVKPPSQPAKCTGPFVGYVAPPLIKVVKDAAAKAGLSTEGVQSIGSVEGLRRIQQGNVPDLFASVDIELGAEVKNARQMYSLGRFKLALACRRPINALQDLSNLTTALADPNKAPIGYRELAFVWMAAKAGLASPLYKYEALGVKFVNTPSGVNITVPLNLPSTAKTLVTPNLDGSWSAFETGQADCVFTYVPYLINKGLVLKKEGEGAAWETYVANHSRGAAYVYVFKPPYDFSQDPPYQIYVNFVDSAGRAVKTIKVGHFEAFVASFTERGDCVVEALRSMDLASYGFIR